jgi:hypothetical protein
MVCHFHVLKYIKYYLERNVSCMYLAAVACLRSDIFVSFVIFVSFDILTFSRQ